MMTPWYFVFVAVLCFTCLTAQEGFTFSRPSRQSGFQFGDGFSLFVPGAANGFNSPNQISKTQRPPSWTQFGSNQNFGANQFVPGNQNFGQNQNLPGNQNFGSNFPANQNIGIAKSFPGNQNFGPNQNFDTSRNFPGNQNFGTNLNIPVNQNSGANQNFPENQNFGTNQNFPGQQDSAGKQNFNSNTQNQNLIHIKPSAATNNQPWSFKADECRAVDGSVGACLNIRSCEPYVTLLRSVRSNPQAAEVLRSAQCGFEGHDPKVCCPKNKPLSTDPPPTVIEPQTPPPEPETPKPQPQTPEPQPQTPSPHTSEPIIDGSGQANSISQFVDSIPEPPVCGVSNDTTSRVVGGVNAKLGAYPWMALLGYRSHQSPGKPRWLCGGSLVTSKHVLTAAHCIHGREDDLYVVRLGELDLSREDEGATPTDVPLRQKIKHEAYSAKSFANDIGLLVLAYTVQFTNLIKPICLPRSKRLRSLTFERYMPFIAGWGDTEFRGPSAPHLQVLQLPVVSNEFCANAYKAYKAQKIDERVLCAGFEKGGRDACQGDSGGPLMQPDYNPETLKVYYYQIGVVSFGRKCAEAGYPGVYSRTTYFMPWIYRQIVGENLS